MASYAKWKVVATVQGQYNQVQREVGEVFELLKFPDGTYNQAMRYVQRKDKKGNLIPDDYQEVPQFLTQDGKVTDEETDEKMHRDFAPDMGAIKIRRGPMKGENIRVGWMKRVPDHIRDGQYDVNPDTNVCEVDFWDESYQLPMPRKAIPDRRDRGPEDYRRNHAPIKDHLEESDRDVPESDYAA